jgi:catechol 2,3-dioxygenase-like lactoylglutathione lyase family enzyme
VKITLSSLIVQDQAHALAFYRDVLGFVLKEDVPAGGAFDDSCGNWILLYEQPA